MYLVLNRYVPVSILAQVTFVVCLTVVVHLKKEVSALDALKLSLHSLSAILSGLFAPRERAVVSAARVESLQRC